MFFPISYIFTLSLLFNIECQILIISNLHKYLYKRNEIFYKLEFLFDKIIKKVLKIECISTKFCDFNIFSIGEK